MTSSKTELSRALSAVTLLSAIGGCVPVSAGPIAVPSKTYSQLVKRQIERENGGAKARPAIGEMAPRARLSYVADDQSLGGLGTVNSGESDAESEDGFYRYDSSNPHVRSYPGSLPLGDPGVSASLWRESRGNNDLFRDVRAWQPMDLLTILVVERAEGKKEADTELKSNSSVTAAISKLFGLETQVRLNTDQGKTPIDPTALIDAQASSQFKGEGETNRKDELTASISAMVVEVLPSGILRVEGQKIIAVNSEEQVMAISGLVRPRDINSRNEVNSSQIANMRIDYFGKGVVDDSQHGGWLSNLFRRFWPF